MSGPWGQLAVWLRSTDVFVSQSHSDYLTRNLVAILAELRAAVGVLAPAAFARVSGICMASFELLERLRDTGFREHIELFEHQPPTELVTPVDIVRSDELGRQVCVCPAGQSPPHWLALTGQEHGALVEPPPPPSDGTLEPEQAGFTPRDVRVGYTIVEPGR